MLSTRAIAFLTLGLGVAIFNAACYSKLGVTRFFRRGTGGWASLESLNLWVQHRLRFVKRVRLFAEPLALAPLSKNPKTCGTNYTVRS